MRNLQRMVAAMLVAGGVTAQTQVDLRTQSKSVDFSGAQSTRPGKTGVTLPALCSAGELFFNTAVPAGSNLYACVSTNVWALQSGGGGGSLTVELDGSVVGTRAVQNFVSGTGMLNAIADTGGQINVQLSVDTSVILSKAASQSGAVLLCSSASASSTAYSCSMSPTLNAYTSGQVLQWKPDVNAAGGATTLNIDTLGSRSVKLADGISDPSVLDLIAARLYSVWYDGSVFRLLVPPPGSGVIGGSQPTCSTAVRGRLWFTQGASGVKDGLTVCGKDSTDTYAWRVLY